MKNSSLIKTWLLLSLLVAGVFTFSACKKDNSESTTLIGTWYETSLSSRTINFGVDNSFNLTVITNNTNSTTTTSTTTTLSGSYTIKNDSLKIAINQQLVKEGNNPPVITPSDIKLYENATYVIADGDLKISYITYPADGPVVTQATFKKIGQ